MALSNNLLDLAEDQADYLAISGVRAHDTPRSPAGASVSARVARYAPGADLSGEVLYWGSGRGQQAARWWLQSDVHCATLMHPDMRWLGIGAADGDAVTWVGVVSD